MDPKRLPESVKGELTEFESERSDEDLLKAVSRLFGKHWNAGDIVRRMRMMNDPTVEFGAFLGALIAFVALLKTERNKGAHPELERQDD